MTSRIVSTRWKRSYKKGLLDRTRRSKPLAVLSVELVLDSRIPINPLPVSSFSDPTGGAREVEGKYIELQVTEISGARPFRRATMRLLEDSMAEEMLVREIKEGDSVIVDVDSNGNVTVLNGSSGAPKPLPEPKCV
ncbi:hypothetical protein CRG98_024333 [Punica granatum]|uniref:Clp ATPase C-terminal domain-containing protein n=1 Tax=Punica granatum TaxID=22663 RepID=A0A2I0JGC4_PUNGR|nr:hypothetical protein CRG98_024333 [Punica granatum]